MKKRNEKHEAIRQSVHVDCPVEDAFRLFTGEIGQWWPLTEYSEAGAEAEACRIEPWVGGRVFERARSGEERGWGEVTTWDPPGRVEFTWNPGGPKDDRQTVTVEFEVEADGTKVTLTHRGWELAGVSVCVAGTTLPMARMTGDGVSQAVGLWGGGHGLTMGRIVIYPASRLAAFAARLHTVAA